MTGLEDVRHVTEEPVIERVHVALYRVPTDMPESDGTLTWDHTDVVVARVDGGGRTGLGWSYASRAAAALAEDVLVPAVIGRPVFAIEGSWTEMVRRIRNAGRPGAGMMAVAAIDVALWDLAGGLLGTSLIDLFGRCRDVVPIYGSGGFTNYTDAQLTAQLGEWAANGIGRVKIKVGRDAADDPRRVRVARDAIGSGVELFVDANGGYGRKQALALAHRFADESGVVWFEEPRPSDDLDGLRFLRDRGPGGLDIAAGEYGDAPAYFRTMLWAHSVDCLQADVTRCGGYTGFRKVAALCEAEDIPLSAHCAPQLHASVACTSSPLRHIEWFHDHVRLERMLFDGVLEPIAGALRPDRSRPGHGFVLRERDAERYRV